LWTKEITYTCILLYIYGALGKISTRINPAAGSCWINQLWLIMFGGNTHTRNNW
jgi:hypothetical protein